MNKTKNNGDRCCQLLVNPKYYNKVSMEGKCPNCHTDLRYVKSINQLFCNDCGFSEPIQASNQSSTKLSKASRNKGNNNLITLIFILGMIIFSGVSIFLIWNKFQEINRKAKISQDVSSGKISFDEVLKISSDINLPRGAWDIFYVKFVNENTDCSGASGNSFVDLCNQAVTEAKNQKAISEANIILRKITAKYGFSRFVDTWGMGTQGLFLPDSAWLELSDNEKQILINYAQSQRFRGIIVGEQKSANNILLDKAVWGQ